MDCREPIFAGSFGDLTGHDVKSTLQQDGLNVISALEARYLAWRGKTTDNEATRIMDDTHACVIEYIQAMLGIDPPLQ